MTQVYSDVSESLAKNRSARVSKPNSRFFSEDIQVRMPSKRPSRKSFSGADSQDEDESIDFERSATSPHSESQMESALNSQGPIAGSSSDFVSHVALVSESHSNATVVQAHLCQPVPPTSTPVRRKRGRPPSAKTIAKRLREQEEALKQKQLSDDSNSHSYFENEENSRNDRIKSEPEDAQISDESMDSCTTNDDDSSNQDSLRRRGLRERRQPERLQPIAGKRRGRPSLTVKDESLLNTLLIRPRSKNGKAIGRPRKRVPVADVLNALQRNPEFFGSKGKCACSQRFELLLTKLDELHKDQLEKLHRQLEDLETEKNECELKLEMVEHECQQLQNKASDQKTDTEMYRKMCALKEEHAREISRVKHTQWVSRAFTFLQIYFFLLIFL
jgi:hypothetical protein